MRQYTMIAALLLIWVFFSTLTGGIFLSSRNLSNLFMQMVTIAILTNGMVLVMVAGNIDLSVGSVLGTLGALVAWFMTFKGMNPVLAISITLAAGFIIGCWHGYWIAFRKVPAFIVTLSSMMAFKGFTLLITKGTTIGEFSPGFLKIGQGYLPEAFGRINGSMHSLSLVLIVLSILIFIFASIAIRRKRISNGFAVLRLPLEIAKIVIISAAILYVGMALSSYRGIPYAILLLIAVEIIYIVITTRTPFGRHVYAIGGNQEAARLSGVDVRKTLMSICMSMGLMIAVGAIVFTSRLNAATTAAGSGLELEVIASCIIGGTSPWGGVGTIFGAIIGATVMASLDNGMTLMNLPIMYQYMIKGFILLLAVWVDFASKKK
jgi:D-xylose transport system permease protein